MNECFVEELEWRVLVKPDYPKELWKTMGMGVSFVQAVWEVVRSKIGDDVNPFNMEWYYNPNISAWHFRRKTRHSGQ